MSKFAVGILALFLVFQAYAQGPATPTPTPTPAGSAKIPDVPKRDEGTQDLQPTIANKRLVISKLKSIQSKQTQLIGEIDSKIRNNLKQTLDVKVSEDSTGSEIRINKIQETMESLEQRRREALERSQFLDRLIFAVDTKWTKDSLKTFMEQTLLDIASTEMNQTDSKAPSNLWKFATYLSVAVRELPEPKEDLISFVDSYLEYSTILNPKSPTVFAQNRSYTNGVKSEAAKVTSQEDLGNNVEKKVKVVPGEAPSVIQGTTQPPLEPAEPRKIPISAPNPQPAASANSPSTQH